MIRKAIKDDIPVIQKMMDELNAHRSKIYSDETREFHDRVNDYPPLTETDLNDSILLVAEDHGVLGYIQGSIHQRKNHKRSKLGSLDELFVHESARGKGIAQELFSALEKELKNSGCDHLVTHTDYENLGAQQLYQKMGMNIATIELWKPL